MIVNAPYLLEKEIEEYDHQADQIKVR